MTVVDAVYDDAGNVYRRIQGAYAHSHPTPFEPMRGVTAETWWCGSAVGAPTYVEARFDGDLYNRAMTVWRVAAQSGGSPWPDVGHTGDPFDPQVYTDFDDPNGFCGPPLPSDINDSGTYSGTGHIFTFANAHGFVGGGFATSEGDTTIDGVTTAADVNIFSGWVDFDVASQLSASSQAPWEGSPSTKTMDWRVAHDKKIYPPGGPWTSAGAHYSFPGYWVYLNPYSLPIDPNPSIYKALWAYGLESLGTVEILTANQSVSNLAFNSLGTFDDKIRVNDDPTWTPLAFTTAGQGLLVTIMYMEWFRTMFRPQIYRRHVL